MTRLDRRVLTVWLVALAWCATVDVALLCAAWWLMRLG